MIIVMGLNNIPMLTKNNIENISLSGRESSSARFENSVSFKIVPAKNAPSAIDTSKNLAEKKEIVTAALTMASVNNSRELVLTMAFKILGKIFLPTTSIKIINKIILKTAIIAGAKL